MDELLYSELDPHEAERLTKQALDGLEDGELFLQVAASESFAFDDGRLKSASFDQSRGFGLRGVVGEVSAYAHANEISAAAIRRAAETVAVVKAGHGGGHTHRHAYAQYRYKQLTGWSCPAAGGPTADRRTPADAARDRAARLEISHELGHGRLDVTDTYLGRRFAQRNREAA